jgi:hypothetical protein
MGKNFDKRRCFITSVEVKDGIVICDLEDVDKPSQQYNAAIYGNLTAGIIDIPPIGSEVLAERYGGDFIVTNVLSIPTETGGTESELKKGAENSKGSMSVVFGPRDGASEVEKISIEYREDGYIVDLDVDGDVNITSKTGDISIEATQGNVYLSEGGTPKKILTEDAVFEYQQRIDTKDGSGGTSTKTTTKVSNGETTEVEVE